MSGTGLCWNTNDIDQPPVYGPCNPMPVAAVVPAPQPIVAPPPQRPAPVAAVPPPPQPVAQKFSLSGDALFAFDKAVIKPEGKAMLDDLIAKLNGATYDTIVATGHTDRIGSDAYNQKLSERRAGAVKAYLMSKNVQAGRIDAEGKGESQPVTKDCKGPTSPKLIACLQPDRRVDVEIKGTKTAAK